MSRIERVLAKLRADRASKDSTSAPLGRVIEKGGDAGEAATGHGQALTSSTGESRNSAGRESSASGAVKRFVYRQDRSIHVNFDALRRAGMLAPENQARELADQYRQIKRPLLRNAAGRGTPMPRANLIMVASAVPGEGKTFTSINLALSMALEKDWSVVLVDGDVARAHLTGQFGMDDEPGLVDLMASSDAQFDEFVLPTDIPNFAIMPAGRLKEHPAELMASARMESLCEQIGDPASRRLIVFDSSPLLATTEAVALATQVGQCALVVYAGHTPQQRVQQAIAKLDPHKAVNLILNMAELGGDAMVYGGPYSYGYGHGRLEEQRETGVNYGNA
jgi:protein-tyrosine kinase